MAVDSYENHASNVKILIVGPLPPPVGGVAEVISTLLKGLRKIYSVEILNTASIPISDISKGKFTIGRVLRSLYHLLKMLLLMTFYRPDVIYLAYSPSKWAGLRDWVFMLLARLFKKNVVVRLDNSTLNQYYELCSSAGKKRIKYIFDNAYFVHIQSELMIAAADSVVSRDKMRIIKNGISTELIDSVILERKAQDIGNSILFMSAMIVSKGVLVLLDAFDMIASDINGSELILAGPWFWEDDKKIIEDRILISPFSDRIIVKGPLEGRARVEVLSKAYIIVNPTMMKEGQSNIVCEGISIGVPVISSDVGAISSVLHHNKGGYLMPINDPVMLADYIRRLYSDKAIYNRMASYNNNIYDNVLHESIFVNAVAEDLLSAIRE